MAKLELSMVLILLRSDSLFHIVHTCVVSRQSELAYAPSKQIVE